jgi:hypothetical protein
LLRRLAPGVEGRAPVHQQSGYTGGGHGESNVTLRSNSVEEESVKMSLSTPTRAVDEEEVWGYRPARVCSQKSSDVVGCVEGGVKGMRDGVVGESLEVVEAGFLLCNLTGKGVAVVKEMGFQNVRHLIMAQRRWRNGEAMLLESVVSTGKEALEIAQSVMAVFVVKMEGRIVEALTAVIEEVVAKVFLELLPKSDGARELAIDQEDGEKAAKGLRHHVGGGVCEGVDPFLVVLREATGDAGVTKSRVDDPVESAEVLKARRSRDGDEEEAEVEALTSGWMNGVHAADGFGAVGP